MALQFPETVHQWKSEVIKFSLQNSSFQTVKCESGSKITHEQFLLLRTLWFPQYDANKFKQHCQNEGWVGPKALKEAKSFIEGLESWKHYEKSFLPPFNEATGRGTVQGSFALVRYYQQLSFTRVESPIYQPKVEFSPRPLRRHGQKVGSPVTPTRGPKSPVTSDQDINEAMSDMNLSDDSPLSKLSEHSPISGDGAKMYQAIEDEAIVNTALVLFLNAITLHCEKSQGHWTLRRHPFTVRSANTNEKIYEARVDGLLRLNNGQHPAAIMEVKSFLRYGDDGSSLPIRMQESAQMAAWIAEHPPTLSQSNGQKHRRLLVSQDRHEIYLNIATFSDDYVDYIRGENLKPNDNAFLKMREYGPFEVDDLRRMNQLANILLGVSIQGGLK